MSDLGPETRLRVAPEVLSQDLDGEAVLLNLKSGNYFGLDPVGSRIWSLLRDGLSLDGIHQRLLDEFDVESDRLWADLLELVEDLRRQGLVEFDGRTG